MERVIFRKERNPYVQSIRCTNQKNGESWNETLCNPEYNYLAIFPDDETNPGMVGCVPFFFDGHGDAIFEPYGEADIGYIHGKTRIVHKRDPLSGKLLQAVTAYYSHEVPAHFRIVEKITH